MSSRPSPLKSPTMGFEIAGVVAAGRTTASLHGPPPDPTDGTPRDRATASGRATTLALRPRIAPVASAPVATDPANTAMTPNDTNNGFSLMACTILPPEQPPVAASPPHSLPGRRALCRASIGRFWRGLRRGVEWIAAWDDGIENHL